ncbi:lysosome-associated membrane glycoprotein 1-like isoform X2 [Tubulanus polymorphus]|uniref:lysosome-associated membrane glycoprotein 1-like isoform X2 n=1 Tax=Tubulanus polymorphus TaxID=672921 RepID=UPI003DA6C211
MQHLRSLIALVLCLAATSQSIHVEIRDGKKVCLIADLEVSILATYESKTNTTNTTTVAMPASAGDNAPGSCAAGNSTKAEFQLVFGNNILTLMFDQQTGFAYLTDASLNMTLPTDAKNKMLYASGIQKLKMSTPKQYFECNSPITRKLQNDSNSDSGSIIFKKLKIQVYNVKKDTYSKEKAVCDQDVSTTVQPPPVTTVTPKPTTSPTPPTGHWSLKADDNVTVCVVLEMGAQFTIPYVTSKGTNSTSIVNLPKGAVVTGGTCGNSTDTIVLKFFDNKWSIQLQFGEVVTDQLTAGATAKQYALDNITMTYVVDATRFKDPKSPGVRTVNAVNLGEFKTGVANSFTCVSKTEIKLDGVKMDTFNLTAQAFKTDNSTTFTGGNQICPADAENKTSNIVPIAVGIALAVLVVIVLIAYIIGRRRSKSSYETV